MPINKTRENDACLIAAAPTMLTTCKKVGLFLGEIAKSNSKYSDEAMALLSLSLKTIIEAEGSNGTGQPQL